ncbi:MAG: hypothetical protein AB1330_02545 [Bacillota bacterium]
MRGRKGWLQKAGLLLTLAAVVLVAFALLGRAAATWQEGLAVEVRVEAKVPPKPKGAGILPRLLPPGGGNPAGGQQGEDLTPAPQAEAAAPSGPGTETAPAPAAGEANGEVSAPEGCPGAPPGDAGASEDKHLGGGA